MAKGLFKLFGITQAEYEQAQADIRCAERLPIGETPPMAKTSKALAKLAADYLNLTDEELRDRVTDTLMQAKLLKDIRKLAASVLRQVEGDGK